MNKIKTPSVKSQPMPMLKFMKTAGAKRGKGGKQKATRYTQ